MKRVVTSIFIISLIYSSKAQVLDGRWSWENKDLSGEVYFGDGKYFIKVFIKDSDIKVSESFSYYQLRGDTLVFSDISFSANPSELRHYVIKQFNNQQLKLYDIKNKETDSYANVDHKEYKLSKVNLNEFYFSGAIGCTSDDVNSRDYNNCLNFKLISILSTTSDIEEVLGKPYSTVEQGEISYTIYLIPSELDSPPYLAVSYNDEGLIDTIQLTGQKVDDQFAFSGIRLGDYFTMVENRLGKATGIEKVDDQTELWSYDPHRISVEIKNGLVYSIKLRRI